MLAIISRPVLYCLGGKRERLNYGGISFQGNKLHYTQQKARQKRVCSHDDRFRTNIGILRETFKGKRHWVA